ncbi:MAG TPA: TadE/TadG family type IV pilus assembly protein [Terracidiphilus sp.]|jgi:Flp pilus assembly protein TadG|nr:TadE/TadG family type IV pilus assembly protein [Terracidiphilus sp.]
MKLSRTTKNEELGRRARQLRDLRGEDGGSLVEFALVAPLMMMLITGMFSVGIALNNYMVLTNGVSAGARAFALSRGITVTTSSGGTSQITDPCAYAVQIAKQAAPNLNSSAASFAITWTPNGGTAANYTTTCSGITLNSGDSVQVKASYPISMIVYGWRPGALSLTGQTTELVQ